MGERKPFTLKERKRWSQDFGQRARNNWGAGDLPAPFCAGDIVELVGTVPDDEGGYNRLRGQTGPFFVVTTCCARRTWPSTTLKQAYASCSVAVQPRESMCGSVLPLNPICLSSMGGRADTCQASRNRINSIRSGAARRALTSNRRG